MTTYDRYNLGVEFNNHVSAYFLNFST